MPDIVTYNRKDTIATITMDDGKVNALSPQMLADLNAALDQAEADGVAAVLTGREGILSGGFDLKVFQASGAGARRMFLDGFELSARMLSFPRPVVVACTGHAIAMAAFLLLSADYRLGAAGAFRIQANEVALGITMPRAAIEMCRQRLTPAGYSRAIINSETFSPDGAVAAGFLDRVVPASDLQSEAEAVAAQLASLSADAHAASKLRAREGALAALRAAIEADDADLRVMFGG
jgi:enoyl-CoA hydratase